MSNRAEDSTLYEGLAMQRLEIRMLLLGMVASSPVQSAFVDEVKERRNSSLVGAVRRVYNPERNLCLSAGPLVRIPGTIPVPVPVDIKYVTLKQSSCAGHSHSPASCTRYIKRAGLKRQNRRLGEDIDGGNQRADTRTGQRITECDKPDGGGEKEKRGGSEGREQEETRERGGRKRDE